MTRTIAVILVLLLVCLRPAYSQSAYPPGVMPDSYRQASDPDDSASINRAISALGSSGGNLLFLAHNYAIGAQQILQTTHVNWIGQGWDEGTAPGSAAGANSPGQGTWIIVSTSTTRSPVDISISGGSIVENLAFFETQMTSPSSGWTPTPNVAIFNVHNISGAFFMKHIYLMATNNGINITSVGRPDFSEIYGQCFSSCITVDQDLDTGRYVDFHIWPFWSSYAAVVNYTQAHLSAFVFRRVDTPFLDRIFIFGALGGIRMLDALPNDPNQGTTSKAEIGNLNCDNTQWCLWVQGTGSSAQIASMNAQGEAFPPGSPPLPQSAAIRVEGGNAVLQVGSLTTEQMTQFPIQLLNTQSGSNLSIGTVFSDFSGATTPQALVNMSGPDLVQIRSTPNVPDSNPPSFTWTYPGNVGTLLVPSMTQLR